MAELPPLVFLTLKVPFKPYFPWNGKVFPTPPYLPWPVTLLIVVPVPSPKLLTEDKHIPYRWGLPCQQQNNNNAPAYIKLTHFLTQLKLKSKKTRKSGGETEKGPDYKIIAHWAIISPKPASVQPSSDIVGRLPHPSVIGWLPNLTGE